MITIIYGKPRVGKTSYMTARLNEYAFSEIRRKQIRAEIMQRNANGFSLSVPKYSVATNYTAVFRKFGYTARPSVVINPYCLGFKNDSVDTYFLPPYTAIGIMEGQRYFNSRNFKKFPDWVSRFYELHGHNYLDIFIDTQRPNLIDTNIRELACFVEIIEKVDTVNGCKWYCRYIDSEFERVRYNDSGRTDKNFFTEFEFEIDYNVFSLYDSRESKPLFYDGNYDKDFDLNYSKFIDGSKQSFIEYNKQHGNELPQNFYK